MPEDNYPLRVTSFQRRAESLKGWMKFLEEKGYQTVVVVRQTSERILYALYRNLSAKELQEIEAGDYVISDEFLMKAKNCVILKEVERWK